MKSDVKKKMTSFSHPTTTPKSLDDGEAENFACELRCECRLKEIFFANSNTTSHPGVFSPRCFLPEAVRAGSRC
jgi:hypothetical protein